MLRYFKGVSRLAILSFIFGIISFVSIILYFILNKFSWKLFSLEMYFFGLIEDILFVVSIYTGPFFGLIAVILGIIAIIQCKRKKIKGIGFAILGILFGISEILFFIYIIFALVAFSNML